MILLRQKIFMLGTYQKGADGKYVKTGDVAGGGGYSLTGNGSIIQGSGDRAKDRKAPTTQQSTLGTGQLSSGPIKSPVGLGKSGVNSNTVANTMKNASSNNANIISQQTQRTQERNVIKNNPELAKAVGQYKSGQNSKPNTTPTQKGSILSTVKNEASNNWNAIKQGATGTWNNMSKAGKIATGAFVLGGTMMIANNIRRRRQAEEEARMTRRYGRY